MIPTILHYALIIGNQKMRNGNNMFVILGFLVWLYFYIYMQTHKYQHIYLYIQTNIYTYIHMYIHTHTKLLRIGATKSNSTIIVYKHDTSIELNSIIPKTRIKVRFLCI